MLRRHQLLHMRSEKAGYVHGWNVGGHYRIILTTQMVKNARFTLTIIAAICGDFSLAFCGKLQLPLDVNGVNI